MLTNRLNGQFQAKHDQFQIYSPNWLQRSPASLPFEACKSSFSKSLHLLKAEYARLTPEVSIEVRRLQVESAQANSPEERFWIIDKIRSIAPMLVLHIDEIQAFQARTRGKRFSYQSRTVSDNPRIADLAELTGLLPTLRVELFIQTGEDLHREVERVLESFRSPRFDEVQNSQTSEDRSMLSKDARSNQMHQWW